VHSAHAHAGAHTRAASNILDLCATRCWDLRAPRRLSFTSRCALFAGIPRLNSSYDTALFAFARLISALESFSGSLGVESYHKSLLLLCLSGLVGFVTPPPRPPPPHRGPPLPLIFIPAFATRRHTRAFWRAVWFVALFGRAPWDGRHGRTWSATEGTVRSWTGVAFEGRTRGRLTVAALRTNVGHAWRTRFVKRRFLFAGGRTIYRGLPSSCAVTVRMRYVPARDAHCPILIPSPTAATRRLVWQAWQLL